MFRPEPLSIPLPITHPDYRFPRSSNPYWTKIRNSEGMAFTDNAAEQHRGKWREQFADAGTLGTADRELHVEIGCNAGHVILEWARSQPGKAFIGIDWKFKPIFRGVEKAQRRGLKNLLFLRSHAERLGYIFGPGEIDHLYLFFPDPWEKRSQQKNRFFTRERLLDLAQLMRPGGVFHIKTDHPGYFEWMLEAVAQCEGRWVVEEMSRDRHANHPRPEELQIPEVTLFEQIFIRERKPIQLLRLRSCSKTS